MRQSWRWPRLKSFKVYAKLLSGYYRNRFSLTLKIVIAALGFAVVMGMVGGFLPAVRAARMNIVDALRAG